MLSGYVVSTINLFEHLVNINNFSLNRGILSWGDPTDAGLERLSALQSPWQNYSPTAPHHNVTYDNILSFCLNYRIYIYFFFSLMTPISPSAFQLRLVLRVQCLRSWRMQKECTQTKINVNIWGRDKQFLREKNYIISICAELISYQRLQLQPKSNICLHHSSPGHSNMLKACREPF